MKKSIVIAGCLVLLLFSFIVTAENTPAPAFTLQNTDGDSVSLSDFAGKVVILNFWATWCPACRIEIPHLVGLQDKYKGEKVAVIGISVDRGGAQTVKPFVEKNNINYPILIGTNKVVEDFGGIYGIPTTFIIDKDGNIAEKLSGAHGKKRLEKEISKLI